MKTLSELQSVATVSGFTLVILLNETGDFAITQGFGIDPETEAGWVARELRFAGLVCVVNGAPVTTLVRPVDGETISRISHECVRLIAAEVMGRLGRPRKPNAVLNLSAWLAAHPAFAQTESFP